MDTKTVTKAKIRSWMNRQRTRPTPSRVYLEWLQKQYVLRCEATVIKAKEKK